MSLDSSLLFRRCGDDGEEMSLSGQIDLFKIIKSMSGEEMTRQLGTMRAFHRTVVTERALMLIRLSKYLKQFSDQLKSLLCLLNGASERGKFPSNRLNFGLFLPRNKSLTLGETKEAEIKKKSSRTRDNCRDGLKARVI
jgi:hypothetical protein